MPDCKCMLASCSSNTPLPWQKHVGNVFGVFSLSLSPPLWPILNACLPVGLYDVVILVVVDVVAGVLFVAAVAFVVLVWLNMASDYSLENLRNL